MDRTVSNLTESCFTAMTIAHIQRSPHATRHSLASKYLASKVSRSPMAHRPNCRWKIKRYRGRKSFANTRQIICFSPNRFESWPFQAIKIQDIERRSVQEGRHFSLSQSTHSRWSKPLSSTDVVRSFRMADEEYSPQPEFGDQGKNQKSIEDFAPKMQEQEQGIEKSNITSWRGKSWSAGFFVGMEEHQRRRLSEHHFQSQQSGVAQTLLRNYRRSFCEPSIGRSYAIGDKREGMLPGIQDGNIVQVQMS